MTDINHLIAKNPNLTIEQYFRMIPKPVEYVTIVKQSAINGMRGIEDKRIVPKAMEQFKVIQTLTKEGAV